MKIIQEDANTLIFEEYPNASVDKRALLITLAIILISFLYGLFTNFITITDLIFTLICWSIFICIFILLSKKYSIKVKVDKKINQLSISRFLPDITSLKRSPVEIPIQDIKKIEYDTWDPFPFYPLNFLTTLGKLTFILHDDTKVELRTLGFLVSYKNYGNIGKKIADYINVPFEI
jgi:hypothetical protein